MNKDYEQGADTIVVLLLANRQRLCRLHVVGTETPGPYLVLCEKLPTTLDPVSLARSIKVYV